MMSSGSSLHTSINIEEEKKLEIKKEYWNGKCPKCGGEDYDHCDLEYEVYVEGGWLGETFVCNKCGQRFVMDYSLTFEGIRYDETVSPSEGGNR